MPWLLTSSGRANFIGSDKISEDALTELALENDAEDVLVEDDHYEIICETADFDKLADAFEKKGLSQIRLNWLICQILCGG